MIRAPVIGSARERLRRSDKPKSSGTGIQFDKGQSLRLIMIERHYREIRLYRTSGVFLIFRTGAERIQEDIGDPASRGR